MTDIRPFIQLHLLEPLKNYPTVIQDTMIEIITQKLQNLYDYTVKFPEIVSPNQNRLDILQAITDQFLFTIRNDADIQEQIDILDNILYIYSKRGSIDTIENMWKYYGGTLPKDVKVIIPSYTLFRYNISKLSGTHKFSKGIIAYVTLDTPAPVAIDYSDNILAIEEGSTRYRAITHVEKGTYQVYMTTVDELTIGSRLIIGDVYEGIITDIVEDRKDINRSGMYEIRLTNNTYPIVDLREFLIKELVAAGNYIYFTNTLHMNITGSLEYTNPYKYIVRTDDLLNIQLSVFKSAQGLTWSGYNVLSPNPKIGYNPDIFDEDDIRRMTKYRDPNNSLYSGRASIFFELTKLLDIDIVDISKYKTYDDLGFFSQLIYDIGDITYRIKVHTNNYIIIASKLYCTPLDPNMYIASHLYDSQGNLIESMYPGYFILGKTLLGTKID